MEWNQFNNRVLNNLYIQIMFDKKKRAVGVYYSQNGRVGYLNRIRQKINYIDQHLDSCQIWNLPLWISLIFYYLYCDLTLSIPFNQLLHFSSALSGKSKKRSDTKRRCHCFSANSPFVGRRKQTTTE
mgnify:CR=1 FL=1